MIFQIPQHIPKIIKGTKKQTRRLGKRNQFYDAARKAVYSTTVFGYYGIDPMGQRAYFNGHKDREIYRVGKDYAVQPGRTKPGVWYKPDTGSWALTQPELWDPGTFVPLRIRLTAIRHEDVRDICADDAWSEGGYSPFEYLCLWTSLYDKANLISLPFCKLRDYSATRPFERYQAWVLTFEVVKGEYDGQS